MSLIAGAPGTGLNGFEDFMYKSIVPACFMAPMKSTFDLADAQTVLVSLTVLGAKLKWGRKQNL